MSVNAKTRLLCICRAIPLDAKTGDSLGVPPLYAAVQVDPVTRRRMGDGGTFATGLEGIAGQVRAIRWETKPRFTFKVPADPLVMPAAPVMARRYEPLDEAEALRFGAIANTD